MVTFSATDQDGDAIVWTLTGDDDGGFTIEGGVLAFKSPPNYEIPVSASVGTIADSNVYKVTVEATDGTQKVVVTVTNVDEDGSVGFAGQGRYQPQVGRGLEATLTDQDDGVTDAVWQWARSMDMQTWTDIEGATSQKRTPVAADDGYYLRASVTYTDMFGSGKMVSAVTANTVEPRTVSNAAPSFADQDDVDDVTGTGAEAIATQGIQVNRDVDENTAVGVNIGSPVSASDADNDVLIYSLVDTPDLKDGNDARFSINRASGQIKVGKKLGADAGTPDQREDEDTTDLPALDDGADEATNAANNNEYVVRVKATDPSGATRTVNVVITVNDINEAPAFDAGSSVDKVLNVIENGIQLRTGADGTDNLTDAAYNADDQDASREIVDATGAENETDASLAVTGADMKYFEIVEAGTLTFVVDNTATEGVNEAHTPNFEKKSSYAITIVASSGQGDRVLRAKVDVTVHVIDAEDPGSVSLTAREPQVGRTVVATVSDPDGGVTLDRWTWATQDATLGVGGAPPTCPAAVDGTWENVDPDVTSGAYTPKSGDVDTCLRATATYTDNIEGDGNEDAEDGNMEMFSKVSEKPVQTSDPANAAPNFPDQDLTTQGDQSDEAMRSVEENMADETVGGPISATDTDGDAMLYTLSGDDSASFKVDNNGQIKTKVKLDFETKGEYMVALTATDPSGAADSILVTIVVTDGPDNAVISGVTSVDYAENGTGSVATFSATDEDGDAIVWSLGGEDNGDFTIKGGVLAFKSPPNYEIPVSASVGTIADSNVYKVTVEATDGTQKVVVTVTNVDEDGSVGFAGQGRYQPQVGRGLEATLTDQDDGVTDAVWQWARSMDMQTWTDIEGATSQKRTPVAADDGYYLRASVTYTDMFGSGKMVSAVTANTVEPRTVSNAAPSFADQDDVDDVTGTGAEAIATQGIQVNRDVDENTAVGVNIGSPVSASDADNDVLIYSLVDTPDLKDGNDARFSINRASGQIKVGKKLGADAGTPDQREDEDTTDLPALDDGADEATNAANNNEYVVRVKATDPSGATRTVNVVITVNDINEAPAFDAGSSVDKVLNVIENGIQLRTGADGTDNLTDAAYNADDQDASREIVDATGAENETDASLAVTGADMKYFEIVEAGTLTFVVDNTATEGVNEAHTPNFEKKSSYAITIVASSGQGDRVLRAKVDVTVHVIDAEDPGSVSLTAREPQVGRTVVATVSDPDGGVALTRWTWATVDAPTGEGETCAANTTATDFVNVTPDVTSGAYTPKSGDAGKCLQATATYTDDIPGDSATAGTPDTTDNDDDDTTDANMDGIDVFKVSEKPVQTSDPANAAPNFPDQDLGTAGDQSEMAMRSVEENMADETVENPVYADDEDGDALLYTLSGDDSASFKVDNNGQIRTKVKLDFETKDMYMVALTATDPSGAADSIMVMITVIDGPDKAVITPGAAVNNPPAFPSGTANRSVDENMYPGAPVGDPVEAVDDDTGDTVTYSIDGSTYFDIDTSTGQIMTTMMLDEEAMSSHSVTVTATDEDEETDSVAVTITVIDSQPGCDTVGDMGLVNDCEALLDSEDALGGSLNWADDTPMSDWDGVTMSGDRVTAVNLRDQGLDGTIPAALGRLSELTSLNLRTNTDLSGEIPGSLNSLSNLTVLNLHSNSHTDAIPDLSGTALQEVYLSGNDLTGGVPEWLNSMTDVRELWLTGNDLSGTMPNLSGMTSLERLKLNGNAVSGFDAAMLPSGLRWLIIGQTDIGATAPDLSGMMSLTTLWMNETGLSGAIPVASIPTSVRVVNLKDNSLSGTIPDMSGLDNLQYLYLHRNELSGEIPGTMGDLESLERLWLHQNDLTGIAGGFANAADTLTHLYLDGNNFAADTCLPGDLADVANNDFEMAGLAACTN